MSQRALMLAVKTHLQSEFTWNDDACDVAMDGSPRPVCGEQFVSIWPGTWTIHQQHGDDDLDEEIGVNITVTRRLGFSPQDRWGQEVLTKATTGLEAILRQILATLSVNRWSLLQDANGLIGPHDAFVEPLRFQTAGRPELKGPDWFSAIEDFEMSVKAANSGVAQTLTLIGSRRLQSLEEPDVN